MSAVLSTAGRKQTMRIPARPVRTMRFENQRRAIFGTGTGLALVPRVPFMDTKSRKSLHETLIGFGLDERQIRTYFSPMMSAICDLVGLETSLAIIEKLGGRQVYFNERATEKSALVRVAGEEKARKIVDFFGGDQHITIPSPFSNRTLLRIEGMKMLEDGQSYGEVAYALRVSRNTVCGWAKKLPMPRAAKAGQEGAK